MQKATPVNEYIAKMDSKKRVTLRNNRFEYYQVTEYDDGTITLKPRDLTVPSQVSEKTLTMMDSAMDNYKTGNVSGPVDLSTFDV